MANEEIGLDAVLKDKNFTKGLDNYVKGLDKANRKTDSVAKGVGRGFLNMGTSVLKFGAVAATALVGVGAAIAAVGVVMGGLAVREAIKIESAFAGVQKTVDGLGESFDGLITWEEALEKGFRNLAKEIPTTVEELMAIGELGGQLGIQKEALLDFTEVIAAMGEATNLTTEAAATGFAQIANIMGTSQDDFDRMGSSIVELGNNMATTESNILAFAQRIASTGQIAGLTEADIFGIGAAMSSVGVEAEAGGTAVQKVLIAMTESVAAFSVGEVTDELEIMAQVAGVTTEEFATSFKTDAAGAFTSFVEGLGVAGDQAFGILDELGLADQRLIRSFLSLAGAGDLLSQSIEMSGVAWLENTALMTEAEKRYATTESQLQIMKNSIRDVGITIGAALLPFLNQAIEAFKPFIDEIGERLPAIMEEHVIPALERLVEWLSVMLPVAIEAATNFWNTILLPALREIGAFMTAHVFPVLQELFAWLQEQLPKAVNFFLEHWEAIKAALLAIGAVLAAAGIVAAIAGIVAALNPVSIIIGVIIAAIGLLAAAWAENWGGIRDIITDVWENKLRPAFEVMQEKMEVILPKAIAVLSDLWENTLLPVLEAVWEFIKSDLIPILADIVAWFITHLPDAIAIVVAYWEFVLLPALEIVGKFITDILIPILSEIVEWLQTNIPIAVEKAARFWEGTLKPALETVGDFIRDTLIPIISDIVGWLEENIPTAIETASDYWENTLKPALEVVWAFIEDYLVPLFEVLVELLAVTLLLAVQAVSEAWESTLKPALEAVWKVIEEDIIPIIETLIEWLSDKLSPAVIALKEFAIDVLAGGFRALKTAIQNTITKVKILIEKLKALGQKTPSYAKLYIPESPPPLALGFDMVATAVEELTKNLKGAITELGNLHNASVPTFEDLLKMKEEMSKLELKIGKVSYELDKMGRKTKDNAADIEKMQNRLRKLRNELRELAKQYKNTAQEIENIDWDAIASGIKSFGSFIAGVFETIHLDPLMSQIDALNEQIDAEQQRLDEIREREIERLQEIEDLREDALDLEGEINDEGQEAEDLRREIKRLDELRNAELQKEQVNWDLVTSLMNDTADVKRDLADLEQETIDKQAEQFAINQQIRDLDQEGIKNRQIINHLQVTLNTLIANRYPLLQKEEAMRKRLVALQEQQAKLAFLQQQLKLLELIQEHNLGEDLIAGINLGLDMSESNLQRFLSTMTEAMRRLVVNAENELGVGSPSSVFRDLMRNVVNTMTNTIDKMRQYPVEAMGNLMRDVHMVAAPVPAAAMVQSPANITRTNVTNVNMGGVSITDNMSAAVFEARVREVIRQEASR